MFRFAFLPATPQRKKSSNRKAIFLSTSANFAIDACVQTGIEQFGGNPKMKRYISIVAVLALTSVVVAAQSMPRQTDQQPGMQQTQQQPATSGQEKAPAVSSSGVQSDIQSALQKDSGLANSNINVQVSGKSVDLLGTVPSKEAKDTAEQIAKAHCGGLEVKNHLKVGPATGAPPK